MLHPYDPASDETLAQYAEGLDDDYAAWPTWHTGNPLDGDQPTHVEMFTWNDNRAGWIGDKSNFEVARDLIRSAADEGRTDTVVSDEQVYECGGGSSAWDVAQLYVQVFEGGCEPDCHGTRTYTAAFRTAVALAEYVKHDYPVISEDDYCEQRHERFTANLDEVLEDIRLHYPFDSSEDHDSIREFGRELFWELDQWEDAEVDWDDVRDAYDAARREHFLDLGRTFMRNEIPGQLALLEVAGA